MFDVSHDKNLLSLKKSFFWHNSIKKQKFKKKPAALTKILEKHFCY